MLRHCCLSKALPGLTCLPLGIKFTPTNGIQSPVQPRSMPDILLRRALPGSIVGNACDNFHQLISNKEYIDDRVIMTLVSYIYVSVFPT